MLRRVWILKWFLLYSLCLSVCLWLILNKIVQLHHNNELATNTAEIKINSATDNSNVVKQLPGDYGKPFYLDEKVLNPVEKVKYDEGWKNYEFNQYVSDLISVQRNLNDVRDPLCKVIQWNSPLPQTSVIIIFYNEAFSVLLRTVHSVLDRSDNKILKEIILVDDFSNLYNLGASLDEYMKQLSSKVKILRLKKREGLIRARLAGAEEATGEVLIFLDSHCEAFTGWLEPLIDPISRNPNVSTVPVIETIDYINFEIRTSSIDQIQVGGFNWNLIYDWHPIPKRELLRRKQKTDPIRSPTMAGGLFAIGKQYFEKLGSYDPGFDIWGAENLEISFKIWMCGGELVTAPCSHVGHIFRVKFPYKFPEKVDVAQRNTMRLAEVWLDDYKKFYYERIGNEPSANSYGDISERLQLKKSLQCKSFDWYLKNIFPEQFLPNETSHYGYIKNSDFCLESPGVYLPLKISKCGTYSTSYSNQFWYLTKYNEIRFDSQCLIFKQEEKAIYSTDCVDNKGKNQWTFKNGQIRQFKTNDCIQIAADYSKVFMSNCSRRNKFQKFNWPNRI